MSPEIYDQAKRIIEQSEELPQAVRNEHIERLCAGKPELLNYIRQQLSASAGAGREMPTRGFSLGAGEIPPQLGQFGIKAVIGQGGMGKVFRAWDPYLARTVAIKTILIGGNVDFATNREILRAEMKLGGKLEGINGIVQFHHADVDEESGIAYIVMEFVDGPSLERMIQPGRPFDLSAALDILKQAAAALDQAHARGVVHCDVKPSNLLLHQGNTVKITDFGLSRFREPGVDPKTSPAQGLGTLVYMSPEQYLGQKALDGRSDQYSLAVVAFQLLTGRLPFVDGSAVGQALLGVERPSASALNGALPYAVDDPLKRGMARHEVDRFDSCVQFVDTLSTALPGRRPAISVSAATGPDSFATVPTHPRNLPQAVRKPEPARPKRIRAIVYGAIAAVAVVALSSAAVRHFRDFFPQSKRPAAAIPLVQKFAVEPPAIKPGASANARIAPDKIDSGDGGSAPIQPGQIPKEPVPLPVIARFVAEPDTIDTGERATLRWEISGADAAAIDQGVGKVEPVAAGSVEVKPPATTEYTLSGTNSTGEMPARATVKVRAPSIPTGDAIPSGDAVTLLRSGRSQLGRHEYPAARDSLLRAANGGNPESMVLLGAMYSEGLGGPPDGPEAARWFQQAADAGNVRGMYNLGHMYANGWEGHKKNDVQAATWYGKAAEGGSADAAYRLGLMFEQGRGVPKDLNEARDLYRTAGTPEARSRLAMLLPKASAKAEPADRSSPSILTLYSISPSPIQENKVRQYTLSGSGFSRESEVRLDVEGFVGSSTGRANHRPVEVESHGVWMKVYISVPSRQGGQTVHVIVHNPDGQEVRLEARSQR